ncbi:MAG: sigma-54-dependent Fis family transcriptional regulator [Betaproteobacteria bacterium]|nr:sigma-54-dependent Fis family transcriptional regulator [Betaproteobacteria bacterium]
MDQTDRGRIFTRAGVAQSLDLRKVPVGLLPSVIEMSWERCLSYGLESDQNSEFDLLERGLLVEQQEKNRNLLTHAQPVMDVLFDQIVDTQNVVVLANDNGYILHSCGDPEFLKCAERVALSPGAEWSEKSRGTNAIGTALAINEPVVVNGDQHFLSANHFLTCSASPIFDPNGRLIGVLDLTGDHRSFNRHTMALVRMSVQMIENRLFASAYSNVLILRFHARPEFVGTLCEGMIALGEDGALLSANRNACFQFGLSLEQMRGASFSSLFGQQINRLFDHLLVRPQDPISLTLNNGIRVQAKADSVPLHLRRHFRLTTESKPATASPKVAASGLSCDSDAKDTTTCPLERLRTGDPQIENIIDKIKKVVGRDIPILILGETGTGKELFANAIHYSSPRAEKPFVAVNCAAIPEGLIESELFGYEEGAFTGARRKGNIGRIFQAHGGTLFLDEIGDMPASLQARLLRVLQERVVTPLGGVKSYPIDIAVICATHQKIRELVSAGKFREDLYFRINGLSVKLPPLRKRTDFEALLNVVLRELCGAKPLTIDPEVRELFRHYAWPGNLRQLSYLLRTAVVMAEDEQVIRRKHLPDDFLEDIEQALQPVSTPEDDLVAAAAPNVAPVTLDSAAPAAAECASGRLQDLALQAIRDAISRNGGNMSGAARELGVSRSTLYRKLQD